MQFLITGGFLISVRMKEFTWLGRDKLFTVHYAVYILIVFALLTTFILNKTTIGRYIYAVGGNEDAAILSGIKANYTKIFAFTFCGLACGIAAAIQVSRISMGAPQAGLGMELQAIAAVIFRRNKYIWRVWSCMALYFWRNAFGFNNKRL